MNIRIALLFIGVLVSASSGAAPADATKPLDPDQAPIAVVDRFGDKAATIQVRTADNHLPGPNEPVGLRHWSLHNARAVANHGQAGALLQF